MKLVQLAFELALGIVKIIQAKGDKAADVRLKDIPGFKNLKREVDLHAEALRAFKAKLRNG